MFPLETCFLWKSIDSLGYNSLVPSARSPESIYHIFGRRLRELREEKGVPQQELAELSGLTRASIANVESGRQRVLLHQVLRFAQALRVDLNTLVPQASVLEEAEVSGASASMHDYLLRLRGIAGVTSKEPDSK
jgi:transcriptional regulator with XRE-family HTH domain